jgi:hypothetical protein
VVCAPCMSGACNYILQLSTGDHSLLVRRRKLGRLWNGKSRHVPTWTCSPLLRCARSREALGSASADKRFCAMLLVSGLNWVLFRRPFEAFGLQNPMNPPLIIPRRNAIPCMIGYVEPPWPLCVAVDPPPHCPPLRLKSALPIRLNGMAKCGGHATGATFDSDRKFYCDCSRFTIRGARLR